MQIEIVDPVCVVVNINVGRVMHGLTDYDQAVFSVLSDVFYRKQLVIYAVRFALQRSRWKLPFLTIGRHMPSLFVTLYQRIFIVSNRVCVRRSKVVGGLGLHPCSVPPLVLRNLVRNMRTARRSGRGRNSRCVLLDVCSD